MLVLVGVLCAANTLDASTGEWLEKISGLGAGMDSFYEYLLKVSTVLDYTHLHANIAGTCLQACTHTHTHTHTHTTSPSHSVVPCVQSYIVFGDAEDLVMFAEMYNSILRHIRKG